MHQDIPSRLLPTDSYRQTEAPELEKVRLLVVGDVMLDRYWFGDVSRISPEAPVPVVRIEKREARLGGAANVTPTGRRDRSGARPRRIDCAELDQVARNHRWVWTPAS